MTVVKQEVRNILLVQPKIEINTGNKICRFESYYEVKTTLMW